MSAHEFRFQADVANQSAESARKARALRTRFEEEAIAPSRGDHAAHSIGGLEQKNRHTQLLEPVSAGEPSNPSADNNCLLINCH